MPRRSVNRLLPLIVIVATLMGLFVFRTQLSEATGRGIAEIGARVIEHQYDVEIYFDHAQMRYATLELEGVGFALRRYPSLEGFAETVRIDFLKWVVELSDGRMPVGPQTLSFDGWFAFRRSAAELSLGLPPTPCQEVLGASPSFVTERLNGLTLRGSLSIDAEVTFDETQPDNTRLSVDLDVVGESRRRLRCRGVWRRRSTGAVPFAVPPQSLRGGRTTFALSCGPRAAELGRPERRVFVLDR
jgi:hypothetical protein